MANHATRVRNYQDKYGVEPVEIFVDRCLSIENLIDPTLPHRPPPSRDKIAEEQKYIDSGEIGKMPAKNYMDAFINPAEFVAEQKYKREIAKTEQKKFPLKPERDILKFLMDYAPLDDWQRDVLGIIRNESYYFLPQRQTKIMNEGWASYWHSTLMTKHVLQPSEFIDYADNHSGAMYAAPGQINPYKLGIELFRDIEERWNRGKFGKDYEECGSYTEKLAWNTKHGGGQNKIFEVRKMYNDITFIDEFLNEEFAHQQKMYTYAFNRRTGRHEIVDRDWQKVKKQLLSQLTNAGQPIIELVEANYENRNELLLTHRYDGKDIDIEKAKLTIANIQGIWNRPVNFVTELEGVKKMLSFDGKRHSEKEI